jgi:ferredoxin-NADP reductase
MVLDWQTGKVVSIIDEAPRTRRFFIETPQSTPFQFKPGQFVTLDLPISDKKNKRLRSYSIASAPDTTNVFELVIVLVEDGLGTNHLFKHVAVGDSIVYRGPSGVFTIPEQFDTDYFLVCTGTGIAPFRSMLHHIYNQQIPTQNIYLIYGTRTREDILYYKEMTEFQRLIPGMHYVPVLSREAWDGQRGYVHAAYKTLCENKPNAHFMLCGWKNMVDEARNTLTELGYGKDQVQFELYG